jgi:carboxypeptidase PM20D1
LGAAAIAKTLGDEGVRLDCVLDEGGVILSDGFKPFTQVPVALIGTAEKVTTSTF